MKPTYAVSTKMALVHHARRIVDQAAAKNPFVTSAIVELLIAEVTKAYLGAGGRIADRLKVELDRLENI